MAETLLNSPSTRCVIHNVGHHDLFVELFTNESEPVRIGWCRPTSGAMQSLGQKLLKAIETEAYSYHVANALVFDRLIPLEGLSGRFEHQHREEDEGLSLDEIESALSRELQVKTIYAPLLHELLNTHEHPDQGQSQRGRPAEIEAIERVLLILVSSGGISQNSTPNLIAEVMQRITLSRWSDRIDRSHYQTMCHHIDTNPHEVTPSKILTLEAIVVEEAAQVAQKYGELWRTHFQLYLSINTGTTLMISALAFTFAEWSPQVQYIDKARARLACTPHQKSRAYNAKSRSLSSIKDWVKVNEAQLNDAARVAVSELRAWREEYLSQRVMRPEELRTANKEAVFFHRKGLKEVLCVVVIADRHGVEGEAGQLVAIRGINLEVSLPTGTLCAERNAIGTALGRFPQLERRDIKSVAVLSLDHNLSKLGPCGACQEWFRKVTEVSPDLRILSFDTPEAKAIFIKPALLT